jgi:hypothetical protein
VFPVLDAVLLLLFFHRIRISVSPHPYSFYAATPIITPNDPVDRGRAEHLRYDKKLDSRPPVERLVRPLLTHTNYSLRDRLFSKSH